MIGAVADAVTGLKGGIIPDRYLNGVTYFTMLLLLLYAFFAGIAASLISQNVIFSKPLTGIIIYGLLIITLFSNRYIVDAYKSVIAAPIYSSIISERENNLKEAAATKSPAVVKDYQDALQEHLQKEYAQSPKTLSDLIQQKPPFLFFEDDLVTEYSVDILKHFYQVGSIIIKKPEEKHFR